MHQTATLIRYLWQASRAQNLLRAASQASHIPIAGGSLPQEMLQRFTEDKQYKMWSQKLWISIVNGTLWVDHTYGPRPPRGWYPAELGGGARPHLHTHKHITPPTHPCMPPRG